MGSPKRKFEGEYFDNVSVSNKRISMQNTVDVDPNQSEISCSKDGSTWTNGDGSLANLDLILVTNNEKMPEQTNDRAYQTSCIAGEGTSIFIMLKDNISKDDGTDKMGVENDLSAINSSTNEAAFHDIQASPAAEESNDTIYIQAGSGVEWMLPQGNIPHNLRDGSQSSDTPRISAKLEDCDSHYGVTQDLHNNTNLFLETSSNTYHLEATSFTEDDKNAEVERIRGYTHEIPKIHSGAICTFQSVSTPVDSSDPTRLYMSDKKATTNSVVVQQTESLLDSSGAAHQCDVVSVEASLKFLQSGLKEGGSVPPSPIRGLILSPPILPMKQHNQLDSCNEECANFSFRLENKFGNDSSGNTFRETSNLGTEDESECVKSAINDKYKHTDQEEKILLSPSASHIMSSDITQGQVTSSNFALPNTEKSSKFSRKKLIVLDLNGLLADINQDYRNAHKAHSKVGGKLVFKRPFCDDFLKFCFERFNVGVWSSRRRYNVDSVVEYLMGDLKNKLLFCWVRDLITLDQSKCTDTGCVTIDNIHKPLLLKELNKLWDKEDPDLPWEKGEYSASNTLLIDDSPYKALCNPPHTAIFPDPYSFTNKDDDFLGPEGRLRHYLEGLAMADDVQLYIQANPFGQNPIADSNPSWKFYHQIIDKIQNSSSLTT
ncbi:hypothetical protein ZIOFF_021315 [Zingiber officinale]|uniref:FCP1 homology domain-containing protein n=1 Tax=Zingiber officinale TaxID=94328 RepID=A0A8J5H033_ZINOF|nr:hypothetical protein ZIOFF_021315 [Zingiber officinale]